MTTTEIAALVVVCAWLTLMVWVWSLAAKVLWKRCHL